MGKRQAVGLWGIGIVLASALPLGGCSRGMGLRVGFDLERPEAVIQYDNLGFRSGERFRLRVMPDINCYLYILNEGTDGSYSMLYPLQEVEKGENYCLAGRWKQIPSQGWYRFDDEPGVERLILLACMKHIGEVEALRNQALTANQVKSVLRVVERKYNARVRKRAEVPYPNFLYCLVASRDPYPVLDLTINMVHR